MLKYIERHKVIKLLNANMDKISKEAIENGYPVEYLGGWADATDAATFDLEKAASADVQKVKHGKWKKKNTSSYFSCSRCGYEEGRETNYCSYCGAKMDERVAWE